MKFNTLVVVLSLLILPGCAAYFDAMDPCQARNRGENYQRPSYCGASYNRAYIYNNSAYPVGFVKR